MTACRAQDACRVGRRAADATADLGDADLVELRGDELLCQPLGKCLLPLALAHVFRPTQV